MLYEWRIIVGVGMDRAGNIIPENTREERLAGIRASLLSYFGGFTEVESWGGWISDGNAITEPGRVYSILAQDDLSLVRYTAWLIGEMMDQTSVVLVHPDGRAELVESSPAR